MKSPRDKYREGHDHIFSDGPPPLDSDDSFEVVVNGESLRGFEFPPDEPLVYPDARPLVTLNYACGGQAFDGKELRCGMMVAPAPTEKGTGMIVHITGTPEDILHMVLATIDSAEAFGLRDAIRLCVERGIGMGDVKEVLGEEWFVE